ncbi:unnamed protein product [Cochlearia groenlandica]
MDGDYRGGSSDYSDDASSMEEETTSSMYCVGKENTPKTEWTDEKHSLYLKSMEASFVNQLYNLLGSNSPCQDQYKVLRDGLWQKMNVKQPEYRVTRRRGGGGSHAFLSSPWIKHYKSLQKTQSCSHSRDRDQISTEEEISDQNFVNEVTKGENGSSKKMKTAMSPSSSTDQVVPIRGTLCKNDIKLV